MSTETNTVSVKETRLATSTNSSISSNGANANDEKEKGSYPLGFVLDKAKLLGRSRARHNLYDAREDIGRPISVMRYLHEESYLNQSSTLIEPKIFGIDLVDSVRTNFPFIYRINDGTSNNTVLQSVCQERGWQEYSSDSAEYKNLSFRDKEYFDESNWNLWWSYNFYHGRPYRSLKCWQFTNHNPRSFQICSKIYLSCFIRRLCSEHGSIYDFIPKSFVLPAEYIPFITEHSRRQSFDCGDARNIIVTNSVDGFSKYGLQSTPQFTHVQMQGIRTKETVVRTPIWIVKPPARSQGKGIYLFTDMCDVPSTSGGSAKAVVQEYITRPLLIGGYKWDIRIYVCVVSVDPLITYMYREGLVRFATEKFDMTQLSSSFSHLTNSSLNKLAPEYSTDKEVIGPGCKWSFNQLRKHFKSRGINDWLMWQKIMSIIVLTVVGESLHGGFSWPINRNCFDFLGFDILVDENMRPYLLEVNYSPGLGGDCDVDDIVKKPMLHQLFDLMGLPNCSNGLDEYSKAEMVRTKEIVKERMAKWVARSTNDPNSRSNNTLVNSTVDCTCKGRLKDARAIYSQDIVAPYLHSLSHMPREKMSAALKTLLRRRKLQEEQVKFTQELNKQKARDETSTSTTISDKRGPSRPVTVEPDQNYVVAVFVHEDQSKDSSPEADVKTNSESQKTTGTKTVIPSNPTKPPIVKDLRRATSKTKDNTINPETAFSRPSSSSTSADASKKEVDEEDGKQFVFIKRPDWVNPPKSHEDWVLVYPNLCTANYRSPYKNPIAELRGAVENMEHYMRACKGLAISFPNHSDESYRRKLKSIVTRWDADIWVPPETSKSPNKITECPKEQSDMSDVSSDWEDKVPQPQTKPQQSSKPLQQKRTRNILP